MTVLQLSGIGKSFGTQAVLQSVGFALQENARLGLVGSNGAGKTTLLKIICGQETQDFGSVNIPGGVRVGYLAQEAQAESDETVWALMRGVFDEVFALEERMRALEHEMADAADDEAQWRRVSGEYDRATKAFEEKGGWGYKSAIKGVLSGLGLGEDVYDQRVNTLSGGQKSRLFLARLLLERPDLLLLDEPTNHLDAGAIGWLEGYLKQWSGAVVVVSHDRWLLDELCSEIVELRGGQAVRYAGNYTAFIDQRAAQREQMIREFERNRSERARMEQMIERYKVWGRIGGGKNFIKAASKQKELDRLGKAERPDADRAKMKLNLDGARRSGNDVLKTLGLAMAFDGAPLFEGLDIDLKRGDRAALVGANGVGKTTLLRIISGRLAPMAGSVSLGAGVKPGYYDQMQQGLDAKLTVIEQMREAYPAMDDAQIRNMLAGFLFYGDDAFKPISALSGGEKGRLSLLILMLGQHNLLLLDEPTNHLDMDSCEVLESVLREFDGSVLFVSHDRYFIDRIATRVIDMAPDGVTQHPGGWRDYLEALEKQKAGSEAAADDGRTKTQIAKDGRAQRALAAQEREENRRIAALEEQIAELETRRAKIEQALEDPGQLDTDRLHTLAGEHAQVQGEIDSLMRQWEKAQG